MILLARIGCIFALLGCVGCDPPVPNTAASKPTTLSTGPSRITMTAHPPVAADARDPQPQLGAMVHLDIYVLDLPVGFVSKDEEFWKRVDEQAIGIADADRLNRNGIRCGVVPRSESLYFSQFFDHLPHHAARSVVDDLHSDNVKLDVGKKFNLQDLFFVDAQNQLQGRSYDAGENELTLAFGPTPRKPGSVRLVFCPTIHSERKRMQFTALNDEYEMPMSEVDRLYDAAITADVSDDSFFIVAPSADASLRTSVGGAFLIRSDQPEQTEQVILVMPTFVRLDGTPSVLPAMLVKPTPTTMPSQSPAQ